LVALGTYRLSRALLRQVGPHSGGLARALRYPNPLAAPWRRPALDVVAHGGIGDVIMCTPALRELKRRNPGCRVRFYSNYGSLVQGLPYIDETLPYEARPSPAIYMDYSDDTDFVAPRALLVSLLGDTLGLRVTDTRMDCTIDRERVARYRAAWQDLPRPHVAVARRASRQRTSNRNWPDAAWNVLIPHLCERATVIELGEAVEPDSAASARGHIDLRARTSVDDLAAAIAAADLYVGPISGPAHIAAAAGTPGVVIYGGYEPPAYTAYPGRVGLATEPPCAPCWLATPCPYDHKCLRAILPTTVEDAIWSLWSKSGDAGPA
jgi:ADP-heptose:LPS heptosyltransferase